MRSSSVYLAIKDAGVGGDGEEVLKFGGLDELAHEEGGVFVGLVTRRRDGVFGAGEFGVDVFVAEGSGDGLAGVGAVREFGAVVDPLPELRAGDLGGGGVFHEIEEWDAADAAQPGFDVAEADGDVLPAGRLR